MNYKKQAIKDDKRHKKVNGYHNNHLQIKDKI
jgi:hypothetical protein